MDCKHLTLEQETKLLYKIAEKYDYLDNGASRAVFNMDNENFDKCGIKLPSDKKYVVKVAIGTGGINQNYFEVHNYINFGEDYLLAAIYYYGKYVEIMEYVDVIPEATNFEYDDEEFFEYMQDNGYSASEAQEMINTITSLEDINGDTLDNTQVGFNSNGNVVSYDYGFVADSGKILVSDLTDYFFKEEETIKEYLYRLAQIATEEEEVFKNLETELLIAYEDRFNF